MRRWLLQDLRSLADDALGFFAGDLALGEPLPMITWVVAVDWRTGHDADLEAANRERETGGAYVCDRFHEAENFEGYTPFDQTAEIRVRTDPGVEHLPGAVAHEMRHIWQD
jgi:hypothetical protein